MPLFIPRLRPLTLLLAACVALGLAHAQAPSVATGRDFIVAVVDTVPVTNHEVRTRALALREELTRAGKPLPANLLKEALERLITEKAMLELAREAGVDADPAAVEQAMARSGAQGAAAQALRDEVRAQLTIQRLAERNVTGRIQISDSDIDREMQSRMQASGAANPEVDLAHILIAVPEAASAAQQQALEQRARDVWSRAQAPGADFDALAKAFSNGPERERGGLMGRKPLDRYPSLFVEAVEKLSVGQVAPLVRSGAGFHILKLVERRAQASATVTETRVRHILLRPGGTLSLVAARAQLASYRTAIEAGRANFAALAREHSQDPSAAQGGELGWVAPGMFVPEFEEVMNKLQPGQLSDPVVSRFGVHLIEVLERRQAPISERELREMVRGQLRAQKYPQALEDWAQEVRGRAYVEYREPPQ